MSRRLMLAVVGLLGVAGCAPSSSLKDRSGGNGTDSGTPEDASAGSGGATGFGGTLVATGGEAGTGAGGTGGARTKGDAGVADASVDGPSSDGGVPMTGDAGLVVGQLVCRPGWKICAGSCVPESPANGCGAAACVPCSGASSPNGFADCSNDACALSCFGGYTKSGFDCNSTGTGTCIDGVAGQFESDVDCGGQDCPACPTGGACNSSTDCQSGNCVSGICQPVSCTDGVTNARESDVDCGGNCGATCQPGDVCNTDADCALGPCEGGVCGCEPLVCSTYFFGQCGSFDDECGGTVDCTCASGDVCQSGTCCPAGDAAASVPGCGHCFNGTKDGDELSQDCGGADCAACSPPQASCTTSTNAGRQYFICSSGQSWTSARDLCAGVGFALATVSDDAENTFLDGALSGSYWIGFNDRDEYSTEGTFVWVSGETSTYTNWNTGEPNDSGGEDCTQLNDGGAWNDLDCSTALPYVCEQL